MNNKIAAILKTYIVTLPWADKVGGLVQTVNVLDKSGEKGVEKSYPVSCDVTSDACVKGIYQALTPDSKKKSIMYFEDRGGVTFKRQEGDRLHYTAQLRLIGWLNLKQLECDTCGTEGGCGVSGDYVLDVIQLFPYRPIDVGGFYGVMIHPPVQVERSVSIFSRYTYNETATQYLMYPYDYFALDFDVDFMINTRCKKPNVIPCE